MAERGERASPRIATAQFFQEPPHLLNREIYGFDHVLLKFRIFPVLLGIREQEGQLGNQILQIMHDKSRHPVERLKLARYYQGIRGLVLRQIASCLVPGDLEQITYFPVQLYLAPRLDQHDEAEQFSMLNQRHDQPCPGNCVQPSGQRDCVLLGTCCVFS